MPDTGDTPYLKALAEIVDGAKKLRDISHTNNTPEFHQFCLTKAYEVWLHFQGCPDDRTKRRDECPRGPACHGYGVDPHFLGGSPG